MSLNLKLFTLLLVSLSVKCVYSNGVVPVYIWGDLEKPNIKSSPLSPLNAEEFDDILDQELKRDVFTVIFVEETLSVEDLSKKDANGYTTYPYFQSKISNALYLHSVDSPLKTLNKVADDKSDSLKLTENGLNGKIEPEAGKFIFISLKDAKPDESRAELLKIHNDFIEKTFTKLQQEYGKVVGIYTAHFPSWTIVEYHSRVRRQASNVTAVNDTEFYSTPHLLLYVKEIRLVDGNNTKTLTNGVATSIDNIDNVTATINFSVESLKMFFERKGGYWFFSSMELDDNSDGIMDIEDLFSSEVYALEKFSYRCAQYVQFSSVNTSKRHSIVFHDMQVQVFFDNMNTSGLAETFGDPFYCVGFTSVPIWSALFIVFILLLILFYGVMSIMDIKTMDRFDDPKGKTITIIAGE